MEELGKRSLEPEKVACQEKEGARGGCWKGERPKVGNLKEENQLARGWALYTWLGTEKRRRWE